MIIIVEIEVDDYIVDDEHAMGITNEGYEAPLDAVDRTVGNVRNVAKK